MEGQIQGKRLKLCVRRRDRAFEPIFKQHSWTQALDKWQEMYNDAIVVIVESEAEATPSVDVNSKIKEISSLISTLASSSATAGFQTHNSSSSTLVAKLHVSDTTKAHLPVQADPIDSRFEGVLSLISTLANSTTRSQSRNLSLSTLVALNSTSLELGDRTLATLQILTRCFECCISEFIDESKGINSTAEVEYD
ncbi:hypothetical protein C8J56DRAFT_1115037 [Mycena floridula]|nr:hypothetical protein C8J56DRAFT_1115037 [Mycena floridula]